MHGVTHKVSAGQATRIDGPNKLVRYDLEMHDPPNTTTALDHEPWVLIATFRDLPQAHVARGTLEAAGLTVALTDEYTVGADWLMSIAIGGVGLGVKASEEETAREILAQESFDVDLAPELSEDLPEELRPDLTDEQVARETEFVEEKSISKRFIAGTAILLIAAPILLPLLGTVWLWFKFRRAFQDEA